MSKTHYSRFDVLDEKEAWDDHTRSIVMKRVPPRSSASLTSLSPTDAALLKSLLSHLLYEDRDDLLDFVVHHIDKKMSEQFGESQRKQGIPPEGMLIGSGLKALNDVAQNRFHAPFSQCDTKDQFALLQDLQTGRLESVGRMQTVPQKELFTKLLSLAVEAYASHPTVWSEMGYAGPAYPRGYYRIELGLHEPWEPAPAGSGPERNGSLDS